MDGKLEQILCNIRDLFKATRKSSCGKPQEAYRPQHMLSVACPVGGAGGGTPSWPDLVGDRGIPNPDLPRKGHGNSIMGWRWGTPC